MNINLFGTFCGEGRDDFETFEFDLTKQIGALNTPKTGKESPERASGDGGGRSTPLHHDPPISQWNDALIVFSAERNDGPVHDRGQP